MTSAVLGAVFATGSSGSYPDGTLLFSQTAAGAWTFTIPGGVAFVLIKGWAPGGSGGANYNPETGKLHPGGGGGGGAQFITHSAVSAGIILSGQLGAFGFYNIGGGPVAGTPTTLSAVGAISLAACTAACGGNGSIAAGVPSAGPGGTASGGTISNPAGNDGGLTNYWDGGSGANGGGDQTNASGVPTTPGGGGPGGSVGAGDGPTPGALGFLQIFAKTS